MSKSTTCFVQEKFWKGFKEKISLDPALLKKSYALPGNQLRCYQTLDLSSLRPFLRLARILSVLPREKKCKLDFYRNNSFCEKNVVFGQILPLGNISTSYLLISQIVKVLVVGGPLVLAKVVFRETLFQIKLRRNCVQLLKTCLW